MCDAFPVLPKTKPSSPSSGATSTGCWPHRRRFVRCSPPVTRGASFASVVQSSFDDDVPTHDSLTLAPAKQALLRLVATQGEFGRVTAGPPGIPADRLATLRGAYLATLGDPAFLAEADRLRLPIDGLDGERLTARVERR